MDQPYGYLVSREHFKRDNHGVAAVEFAIILPVMLLVYAGVIDVTRGVMSVRKVDLVSRTLSDLVSQQSTTTSISPATISTIFAASSIIMHPFSTSSMTMTVSALTIKAQSSGACCNVTVNWSYSRGGTLRPCNVNLTLVAPGTAASSTNLQAGLVTANTLAGYKYSSTNVSYLIVADVTYTYSALTAQAISWFATGFQKTTYMVPRSQSGQISLSSSTAAVSGDTGAICS